MNNRNLQAPPPPPAPPAPRHHELHNPPASQCQVIAQPQNFNFPQHPYYGQMHHQAHSSNMHSQVSPTPGAQLVQPVQVPQVPKGAQSCSHKPKVSPTSIKAEKSCNSALRKFFATFRR